MGFWRRTGNDHEGLPPPGPDPGQPDPEETISRAKLGPGGRSLVHGELVAQGEVLQGELTVAATEEREESKHVEQEGDHRAWDSLRIRADRSTAWPLDGVLAKDRLRRRQRSLVMWGKFSLSTPLAPYVYDVICAISHLPRRRRSSSSPTGNYWKRSANTGGNTDGSAGSSTRNSWHDATKLASAFRPGDDFAMKSARVSSESSAMRTKCPATAVSHPGSLRFGPPNIVASRHEIPCGGPDAAIRISARIC